MKLVYLEPIGGLGNRMRAIASCIWATQLINAKLIIVWKKGWDYNSDFHDHFKKSEYFDVIDYKPNFRFLRNNRQKIFFKKLIIKFINKVIGFDYFMSDPYFKNQESFVLDLIKANEKVYFKTFEEFGNLLSYKQIFKPNDKLQTQIDSYVSNFFLGDVIGVHIRRTDNEISIKNSPLEKFISYIESEINNNPDIKFFLATDDYEIKLEFLNMYNKNIITREKIILRNSEIGIEEGIIDLWCLSTTKYIYGSYWSSYSRTASRIGSIKLIVVKNE